jgi:DNA ligase-1
MITLYKKSRKGDKYQEWTIERDGGKFRTIIGEVSGKLHTSEWTECKVKNSGKKNETSPETQAIAEVEAKITKKKKEGYYESMEESNAGLSYFEPMLAKKYFDRLDLKKDGVTFPAVAQTKFNGGRCIATKEGLFTRKGERWMTCPHIEQELKPFFEKNPDAVLDGELFNHELREKLSEIMELIRRTVHITPEHLEASREMVKLYIYDGFGFSYTDGIGVDIKVDKSDDYTNRSFGILSALFSDNHKKSLHLEFVTSHIVNNHEEVMDFYNEQISEKHEGVIIRLLGKPYKSGRASWLLKMKPTDDKEGVIVSINEGDGNRAGQAATITILMEDGRTVDATVGGKKIQREEVLKNKEDYIGKKATYYFNGYTSYGIPNYAQFDPNNSMGGAADK